MDFPFNVSLGRHMELYNRVNDNDPGTSALTIMVLALTAIEDDDTLRASTDFADILSGASNEVTNTNYARKTLTDADLAAYTVDHDAKSITVVIPILLWSAGGGPATGDSWEKLIIGYNPAAGADSTIIPLTAHDLRYSGSALVPNGSPITVDLTAGFAVARPRR